MHQSDGDIPAMQVLRALVAEALSASAGAGLVASLEQLTSRSDLSARAWLEVAAAWKRVACLAAAGQQVAVSELDRAEPRAGRRWRRPRPTGAHVGCPAHG